MSIWKNIPLGKTALQFIDGDRSKRYPSRSEFVDSGILFLNAESINSGVINRANANHISEDKYREIKKGRIQKGDILLTTRGNGIGDCAIVNIHDRGLINAQMLILRTAKKEFEPYFLFYYFSDNSIKSTIKNFSSGSAQPQIPIRDLKFLSVPIPPLSVQKKIAAILSAYDDLIENNNRRIAILEKMAEEIYREWFVRLRFPGHEQVKFNKGIPQGWEVVKIKDIVNRKPFGKIYRENELLTQGAIIVIDQSQKEFLGFHNEKPEHMASLNEPIIIFGDHTCKMQIMTQPFSLAENVIPFTSKKSIPVVFLYYLVKNLVDTQEYKRHWTELCNKEVYIPDSLLSEKFSQIIIKHLVIVNFLQKAIWNLKQTRDRLLTRLISGKLSVEDLDIQFPPSMTEELE
ncbi:restriction endonuclease subunit S [Nostoc sp. CCY0012]|uniref:restriction endonuclease subunit S n=1 Tax=Nostoc sp. CCY0012 TaxID=1056123 RepID=UPI0039C6E5BD